MAHGRNDTHAPGSQNWHEEGYLLLSLLGPQREREREMAMERATRPAVVSKWGEDNLAH